MKTYTKNKENNLLMEELQKNHYGGFTIWCILQTGVKTNAMNNNKALQSKTTTLMRGQQKQ